MSLNCHSIKDDEIYEIYYTMKSTRGVAIIIGLSLSLCDMKAVPHHRLSIYSAPPFHQSESVMARLCVTMLTFCLMLCIGVQCQSKRNDICIYQGDEDVQSFYQGGDVVLGGLFPLHSSPIGLVSSFRTKPKPTEYKLYVMVLSSAWC